MGTCGSEKWFVIRCPLITYGAWIDWANNCGIGYSGNRDASLRLLISSMDDALPPSDGITLEAVTRSLSPSLADALVRYVNSDFNPTDAKRLYISLVAYYSRLATRSIPFGMSVTIGRGYGSVKCDAITLSNVPSLNHASTQVFEPFPPISCGTQYTLSPSIVETGETVIFTSCRYVNGGCYPFLVTQKASRLRVLLRLLKPTRNRWMSSSELRTLLKRRADRENDIQWLLKCGILLCNEEMPITQPYLLSGMHLAPARGESIAPNCRTAPGTRRTEVKAFLSDLSMNGWQATSSTQVPYSIDMVRVDNVSELRVPQQLLDDIKHEVLRFIGIGPPDNRFMHIEHILLEEVGAGRVPFLRAAASIDRHYLPIPPSIRDEKFRAVVNEIVASHGGWNKSRLQLSTSEINELISINGTPSRPFALAAMCTLYCQVNRPLPGLDYKVALNGVARAARAFATVANGEQLIRSELQALLNLETHDSGAVHVEVLAPALGPVNEAILQARCVHAKYFLPLQCCPAWLTDKEIIGLDDIEVQWDGKRFRTFSSRLRGEVILQHSCPIVWNVAAENPVLNLLSLVMNSYSEAFWSWRSCGTIPWHTPRISSGKVILDGETWRISRTELNELAKANDYEIATWRNKISIPRLVRLTEGDRHLRVVIDDAESIRTVLQLSKRGNTLKFVEDIALTEGFCVASEKERYYDHDLLIPIGPESGLPRKYITAKSSNRGWIELRLDVGWNGIVTVLRSCLEELYPIINDKRWAKEWSYRKELIEGRLCLVFRAKCTARTVDGDLSGRLTRSAARLSSQLPIQYWQIYPADKHYKNSICDEGYRFTTRFNAIDSLHVCAFIRDTPPVTSEEFYCAAAANAHKLQQVLLPEEADLRLFNEETCRRLERCFSKERTGELYKRVRLLRPHVLKLRSEVSSISNQRSCVLRSKLLWRAKQSLSALPINDQEDIFRNCMHLSFNRLFPVPVAEEEFIVSKLLCAQLAHDRYSGSMGGHK